MTAVVLQKMRDNSRAWRWAWRGGTPRFLSTGEDRKASLRAIHSCPLVYICSLFKNSRLERMELIPYLLLLRLPCVGTCVHVPARIRPTSLSPSGSTPLSQMSCGRGMSHATWAADIG